MLVHVPLHFEPRSSWNGCLQHLIIWLYIFSSENRPRFGEITGMEGKNSTDCEETMSEIHIGTTIYNFIYIYMYNLYIKDKLYKYLWPAIGSAQQR